MSIFPKRSVTLISLVGYAWAYHSQNFLFENQENVWESGDIVSCVPRFGLKREGHWCVVIFQLGSLYILGTFPSTQWSKAGWAAKRSLDAEWKKQITFPGWKETTILYLLACSPVTMQREIFRFLIFALTLNDKLSLPLELFPIMKSLTSNIIEISNVFSLICVNNFNLVIISVYFENL